MRTEVVLISTYPAPGETHRGSSGVASYTANLARAMAAEGASVAVVAPNEPGAPARHHDHGVEVVRSGPRSPFALVRSVQMAARMSPRLIHLQHEMFLFGGLASLPVAPVVIRMLQRLDADSIVTLHQVVDVAKVSPELMRVHRIRIPAPAMRAALGLYQRILGSTDATVVHEKAFTSQIPNAVVIPHGVETPDPPSRSHARRHLGLAGEQRLVVLCFGFVAPYKGLEHALAAVADVPEVLLVVAGGHHPRHGSSYADSLKRRWGGIARFVGWVPEEDIGLWHSAADLALFCYPAPHSSSGALATALAYQTPFLASEALACGMDLPRELSVAIDKTALERVLRRVARDRRALIELRRRAKPIAVSRSWREVARRHLVLYQETGGDDKTSPLLTATSNGRSGPS